MANTTSFLHCRAGGAAAFILLIAASLPVVSESSQAKERSARPNIVLIFTDDQGYSDVGVFGAKGFKTPNIDRLAKNGTTFTDFHVTQPVCTASRASLMTGCYSNRVGLYGALNHKTPIGIHEDEVLLSELLKSRGYATACYGKWHLGRQAKFNPLRHGFDEFFGIPYSNDNGPLHPILRDIPGLPLMEGEKIIGRDPDQSQFTRWFTERSVKFINEHKKEPFFLYVPHVMPHVPIFASKSFQGSSELGLWGDVIQEIDWSVGEIVKALKENDLDENTLVIFCSDNGPFLSYGEHAGHAEPLREGKLTSYEGGVRVPAIMRWTDQIPAGKVCDELVISTDLLPTLAKLAGAKLPDRKIDGLDVWPVLSGEPGAKSPHDVFYYYVGGELQAVRSGPWKLHFPHDYLTVAGEPGKGGKPSNFENLKPMDITQSGVRGIASRHGYKVERTEMALYNLDEDIGEMKDVSKAHPQVVERLKKLAEKARADLGDTLTNRVGENVRPAGVE